jgi:hypothetical protein
MTPFVVMRTAAMVACLVCWAPALAAQAPEPTAVIRFDQYPLGDHLITVRASIRGHAGTFLFDTGEGVTLISTAMARTIGCTPWGQVTAFRMLGDRIDAPRCDAVPIEIADQGLSAPSVLVFDIMKFFPPNAPALDGSIGLDLFAGRAVTVELSQNELIVESPLSLASRIGHATRVPLRIVRDAQGLSLTADIGVATPDGTAWMELDSGSGGITISNVVARLLKLDPESKAAQPLKFTIGDTAVVEGRARVLDHMIMDGNIGASFLMAWNVTLDLAAGRAWIAPAASGSR